MKKYLYYLSLFLIIPILLTVMDVCSNFFGNATYWIGLLLCCVFVAVLAHFTRSPGFFDGVLTVTAPLAAFVCMFLVGFLDRTETYARFTFRIAIEASFQPRSLILYVALAVVAFLFSTHIFKTGKRRVL